MPVVSDLRRRRQPRRSLAHRLLPYPHMSDEIEDWLRQRSPWQALLVRGHHVPLWRASERAFSGRHRGLLVSRRSRGGVGGECGLQWMTQRHLGRLRRAAAFGTVRTPPATQGRIVSSLDVAEVGAQLDEDHAPETNGRMSVCRRCGARTDALALHHVPDERQLARSRSWLIAEAHRSRVASAREVHSKRVP